MSQRLRLAKLLKQNLSSRMGVINARNYKLILEIRLLYSVPLCAMYQRNLHPVKRVLTHRLYRD